MSVRQCHALHRLDSRRIGRKPPTYCIGRIVVRAIGPTRRYRKWQSRNVPFSSGPHLRQIGSADLRNDEDTDNDSDVLRTIHNRFAQERRAQRFHRRRQRRRRTSPASTHDDEDSQNVSDSVVQRSVNCSPSMSDVAATGARQQNTSPPSGQPASPAFSSGSDSTPSATRPVTPPAHSSGTLAGFQSAHTPTIRQSQTKTLAISSQPSTSFAHTEESASNSSNAIPSFVDAREDAVVVSATTVREVQQ